MNSIVKGRVNSLPSSKSLSNRALILNALTNNRGRVENLSSARDTALMKSLIDTPGNVIDVMDAGTTMRFLTAYFALTNQHKLLTGSDRMKERPISHLVDALRKIGADIRYTGKDGFPPIEIRGFAGQVVNEVRVRADVSSQFISALMMTAAILPKGLTIRLEGKTGSLPYLLMTADLMKRFGGTVRMQPDTIEVAPGGYRPATYRVEPDWSAASYWFSVVALSEQGELLLPGVESEALQGDRVIVDIMGKLGVKSVFGTDGLRLSRIPSTTTALEWDFTDCPDLAQTVLPACAVKGIQGTFTGLESLRIKETDRIAALQTELSKVGANLTEGNDRWGLTPGKLPASKPVFRTYHDHRMAMGFAPLATVMDVSIEDPAVVNKSYPTFWDDLRGVGFRIR